jgi:peptide/nickel transport system substrate-binding protein
MAGVYDRRTFLDRGLRTAAGAAVLGGGASVLLDACASSGNTSATTSSGAGVSTATPKRGGTVHIGVGSEINSLDPGKGRWDPTGYLYAETVLDPLAAVDAQGNWQPYLAESITPNADHTVWTIGLRPGITFHDGTPCDATAVRANLDNVRSSALTGPALKPVTDVSVTDPMTVVITLHQPWVPFPFSLAGQPGYIAAPSMLSNPNGGSNPVGTGPFVFQEWVPNDHFSARRNPHYWRQGLPYLDGIEYRVLIEQTAQESSIRSGAVDMLNTAYPQIILDARNDSSLSMIDDAKVTVGEPSLAFVMLNTAVAPMNDIRVRQALAHATNQVQISQVITSGLFTPRKGLFIPGSPYYSPSTYPSYDPAKARQLVQEYTREKGPISFDLGTINTSVTTAANQLIQQQWQAVGIQTHIAVSEETTYIANALNGNYHANAWIQFNAVDPDNNYVWWSTTTAAPVGQSSLNFARNSDPQIEAALQQGRRSTDQATRVQAYQKVNERINTDLPYIWLFQSVGAVVARANAMNYANPSLPNGAKEIPFLTGVFSVVQIWLNQ